MPTLQAGQNSSKSHCFLKTVVDLLQEPRWYPPLGHHFLADLGQWAWPGSYRCPWIFQEPYNTPQCPHEGQAESRRSIKLINIWGKCVFPTLKLSIVQSPHILIVSRHGALRVGDTWKDPGSCPAWTHDLGKSPNLIHI